MSTELTRSFLDLAEACVIFAKYNNKPHPLMPPEDIIYVKVRPTQLTAEDREKLDELGWHVDGELGLMAWRTGRFSN